MLYGHVMTCRENCKQWLTALLLGAQFHKFPIKNKQLLTQWYRKIKRQYFIANENSRLCSQHFEETEFVFQPFIGKYSY
jgi:THAP domain